MSSSRLTTRAAAPESPAAPRQEVHYQLERLYREIGISAVASALHMTQLASIEQREAIERASKDVPKVLRNDDVAA